MAMGNAQVVFSMKADATQLQAALRNVQGQATLTFKTITANAAMAEEATAKSAISLAGLSTVLGGFKLPLIAMAGALGAEAAAFGLLVKANMGFDKAIRMTAAAGNLTAGEMAALTEEVNRLAMQWGIAGQQIAEGALELVKAGVSGSELMSVLGAITMATATGFVDFQTAANLYI